MTDTEMIMRLKKIRENYTGKDDEALTWAIECIRFKRPHGEWIFKHNSSDIWCSNCDENFDEIPQKFLFCPNCGADMRKENANENANH